MKCLSASFIFEEGKPGSVHNFFISFYNFIRFHQLRDVAPGEHARNAPTYASNEAAPAEIQSE